MRNIETKDFYAVKETHDGLFCTSQDGISCILQSKDRKIYIIIFNSQKRIIGINTRDSYISYYPLRDVEIERPIKAVLMDLDGTTLYSERFWIHVIEETIRLAAHDAAFFVTEVDIPFVSGHSVSEHLQYCIDKYYPLCCLVDAINIYYDVSHRELDALIHGQLRGMQVQPAFYLKEFLHHLSDNEIKIGLVTSGLYEKAYPEIWSVCSSLELGTPESTYNSIITAGYPLKDHHIGTLGELSSKPHPWLYLEAAIVGLGIPFSERSHVIGIEDSGAGICALCAAGIPSIGMRNGNITRSGLESLCSDMCNSLEEIKEKYL